jgi:hypothetical protein
MANPMMELMKAKAMMAGKKGKPALDEKEPKGVVDSPAEEKGEPPFPPKKKGGFPFKKKGK